MSIFEPFGVIGWNTVQYPLIASLVARISPLLVGDHGAYKTDGAMDIMRLLLGPNARLRKYETQNCGKDELLGFPDPNSLKDRDKDGNLMLKFAFHKMCVWLQDGIVLDEVNMASMAITSCLHELVREGTVMGDKTPVVQSWGTLNPPDRYGTYPMNPAFASRYSVIEVPSIYDMAKEDRNKLINSGSIKWDYKSKYAKKLRKALLLAMVIMDRNPFTTQDRDAVVAMVSKVLQSVGPFAESNNLTSAVRLSGRQTKNMVKMFLAIEAFKASAKYVGLNIEDQFCEVIGGKNENSVDYDAGLMLIAKACMPEAFGIIKRRTNWSAMEQRLSPIICGFRLDEEMAIDRDISYFAMADITDPAEFARRVSEGIKNTQDLGVLTNTMAAVNENATVSTLLSAESAKGLKTELIDRVIDQVFPADEIVGSGVLWRTLKDLKEAQYEEPEVLAATDLLAGMDFEDDDIEDVLGMRG